MSNQHRMPPLQGLYYFYQAAHHGSFKDAAETLHVTAAAVSQQIRLLEDWLGTPLFYRQHRKVVLTPEGQILLEHSQKGFQHIQQGIRLLNQDPDPYRLSLSTLPSLSQHWLVPRMTSFRDEQPDISLLIESKVELVDFEQSPLDLCIRYGKGEYPNLSSLWLMDDLLFPVCHPLYQKENQIDDLKDLHRAHLIGDLWPDMNWERWLSTVGVTGGPSLLSYDGANFVLEGALAVQGVALARHSLAQRYLEEGTLIRIGNVAVRPPFSYYLCAPEGYFRRDKVKLFCDWIRRQAAAFQRTLPEDLVILSV
ncbi:LysR substrate-binding domain-containing protein [Photobacterium sp. 1_MG-2023]|uniref:LysR substrate-binding domain-containing protein n=1 Tax=Photobacterium sp. 1_MG-2023 TaxID=3062646 RepID=UPI0026E408A1|nr:LysR substrate-binding domain-containing protein [Photobacterium sp. 1_MG-2023]MDO6708973.1 LysR substrate-binding domain-containing protein [Photobacterium sp. 1_MG-2023]